MIGAGMAGMACARAMRRAGLYVEVFEASGVVGGRMGTSRLGLVPFDHGSQYVSARSTRFRSYIDELVGTGYAAPWAPRMQGVDPNSLKQQGWFVGTPGMSALVRPLAEGVQVHTSRRVHTMNRVDSGGWELWFDDQSSVGTFSAVAVCVPAPSAGLILGRSLTELADAISDVRMSPCWALMVQLDDRILPDFDAFSDMSQVIRWIGRNNSKPGRSPTGEHIVVHAAQDWSRETEDVEPEVLAEELWGEVRHVFGLPDVTPRRMQAHLWKNGLVDKALGETYLFSSELRVGVAGDWCRGRLAEQAFESGTMLGRSISDALT